MIVKVCSKCGAAKPLEAFPRKKNRKGELCYRADCKECRNEALREFMVNHPGYSRNRYHDKGLRETTVAHNRERRQNRYSLIKALKETTPCLDCGGFFPSVAMDFDHRDRTQKIAEIPAMVKTLISWPTIMAEIAKCDLVCANCHRLRTYPGDGGTCYKTRLFRYHFNVLGQLKESIPCLDCEKLYKRQQMDLDHLDRSNKVANIAQLTDGSTEVLLLEIAKCHLVCANCHRIREATGERPQVDQKIVPRFESLMASTPYPSDERLVPFPLAHLFGIKTDRDLADQTGVSIQMVAWYRRKAGIMLRSRISTQGNHHGL